MYFSLYPSSKLTHFFFNSVWAISLSFRKVILGLFGMYLINGSCTLLNSVWKNFTESYKDSS